jgi:hypothetical protein
MHNADRLKWKKLWMKLYAQNKHITITPDDIRKKFIAQEEKDYFVGRITDNPVAVLRDPSKPCTPDNFVICDKEIAKMKGKLKTEDFIILCTLIVQNAPI